MNMIFKALLLSAVACAGSDVVVTQPEVEEVTKASFIELSGNDQVNTVTKAFVSRKTKVSKTILQIYTDLKASKNPDELVIAKSVLDGLSESLLKSFLDEAELKDNKDLGALLTEVETDVEFKDVVLPQEVKIVAGLKKDEKKDALDEPKKKQLDAFKNQVAEDKFKQYAEVDSLSNEQVQKDEEDEVLLKDFEINEKVAALTLQVYDLSKASEEADLSDVSDEVKSKFETIIELLLKNEGDLSEEELNEVQEILKIKVALLFDIKTKKDSNGEELSEVEQKALERILEIIESKDDLDLLYHEIIEKNFMMDLISSIQSNEKVSKDSVENKSRIEELKFSPRRDDRLYNKYLDLDSSKLDPKQYEAEKKKLEEAYINGYTPTLWESYDNEDNLLSLGSDEAKNYINIPIYLNFTEEQEGYTKKSIDSYYNDIRSVMDNLRQETCVNFSEVDNIDILKENVAQQYIEFRNDELRGCDEIIGRKPIESRPQIQALSLICLGDKGSMAHYFMHNLGFDNEHQRPDVKLAGMGVRDDMEESHLVSPKVPILQNRLGMNDLKSETDSASFLSGVDYDIYSVMHWSHNFIEDTENTLFPHMRTGMDTFFSDLDIEKINILYNCNVPKLYDTIEKVCHYNIISDGEVEVSEACLYDELEVYEDGINGNAHVHVEKREGYKAIVNLSYNLEKDDDYIPSADSEDSEEGDKDLEEVIGVEKDLEAPVEKEVEEDAEIEESKQVVDDAEIEESSQQDQRLLQDETPVVKANFMANADDEVDIEADADEQLLVEADADKEVNADEEVIPSEDDIEPVEKSDAAIKNDDAVENSSHLKDVVFDEENTQEKWELEYGVDFENSEIDNSSMCNKAQLGVVSEDSANAIFCGSKMDDKIEGACNQEVKISYRLVDTSDLTVVTPSLKVNVQYEACSDETAALIDTESNSTVYSSYIIALMSLF